MKRIISIDIVRGIVMVIMALDHVRDLLHVDSIAQSPTNLQTTSPLLFFTRWITYLCAPTFVFLAGTSAYLSFQSKNNVSLSRSFLLKRGFYLIFLDLFVVNFALFFDFGFHTILFEVIAAIGFGFIILGLLLRASAKTIGIIGLIIIFCHNLLPFIPFAANSTTKNILSILFSPVAVPVFSNRVFVMGYPPIPWLGIMLIGFAAGKLFQLQAERRRKLFFTIGLGALLLFTFLRYTNFYGDPSPWLSQKNSVFTFLSFMNIAKYPPSLLFCLVTLGIMFLMLAVVEFSQNKFLKIVSVYGRVPLFYFLAHFFIIHLILLAVLFMQGFSPAQLDFASGTFGRPKNLQSGLQLWVVFIIWISVVAALYVPCYYYDKYKLRNKHWWLKYL